MKKVRIGIIVLTFLAFFLIINTASAGANLTVTSINAPSPIGTEEEMNVTYTVQNQGNETFIPENANGRSGAPTTVFLSVDSEWDESDIPMGTGWYGYPNPPIVPGESYSQTITVTCPGVPEGNYYLLTGLDFYRSSAYGFQYQPEYRHGLYNSPIFIKNPDLTFIDSNTPSSVSTHEEITVSFTVSNQGNSLAGPKVTPESGSIWDGQYIWFDSLYLSTDSQLNESDIVLREEVINGLLNVEDNYTDTYTFTVPDVITGNYYLIAKTNSHYGEWILGVPNYIYESNMENNVLSLPITILNPDLVVTNISSPTVVYSQQTIEINYTILNQGNGDAVSEWGDSVYLSVDEFLDSSDTKINDHWVSSLVSSGQSYIDSFNYNLPMLIEGNFYIIVKTNSFYGQNGWGSDGYGPIFVFESNESNNILTVPITLLNPDLVVNNVSVPTVASSMENIAINYTILNQGNGSAQNGGQGWFDEVFLSTDNILDEDDTSIHSTGTWSMVLPSGQSYNHSFDFNVPMIEGNYYIIVKTNCLYGQTDYGRPLFVFESNENNNIFAAPIYICENIWDVYPEDVIQNFINGASPGDVINFHGDNGNPYTYIENLLVDKTLIFQEYGDGEVTLQANNTNQAVILIDSNGNNTIINGFTITSGSNGIYINGAKNCSILNNTLTDNTIGILVMGNENNIYNNNVSSNGWAGICLSGVSGNLLECNTVTDNSEGIYILNSNNNALNYNIVTTNSVNGINIVGGGQNTIINNMVTNNGVSTNGNGVILKDTTGNNLWKNQVNGNGWSGIVMDNSSDNRIWDAGLGGNIINGNGNGLVLFNGCDNNTITGNWITSNLYNGLQLFVDCQYNQVYGNWILNNQVTGMLIQLSDNNNITGNNVTGSSFNGIALESADNNIINTNTITQSGSIGLILVASNNNLIQTNELTSTFWTNIAMDQSNNNLIQGNTINGTGISDNGIWFQSNCNWNNITSNIITENKANGLFIQSSTNNLVNYNKISQNTGGAGMGLLLVTSTSTVINHNTFQDNGWVGTCLSGDSNGNTITENNYISTTAQVSQAFDAGTNTYDNGASGNYWSNWGSTSPRPIDGGSNVDNHPSLTEF